jgi:hypothetical protein
MRIPVPLIRCAFAVAGLLPALTAATQPGLTHELAPLGYFVGHWLCAGYFSSGKPIHSRETFTAELDGRWLRMQHADEPPNRYAAAEWWGYERSTKHFVVTVFDNGGGVRRYTSPGWIGTTLTLDNSASGGYIDRFVFRRQGDSRYTIGYAHRDDTGAWKPGDELACTKDAHPHR